MRKVWDEKNYWKSTERASYLCSFNCTAATPFPSRPFPSHHSHDEVRDVVLAVDLEVSYSSLGSYPKQAVPRDPLLSGVYVHIFADEARHSVVSSSELRTAVSEDLSSRISSKARGLCRSN